MNLSSFKQIVVGVMRVGVAVIVGSIGGMMGGMFGQIFFGQREGLKGCVTLGWAALVSDRHLGRRVRHRLAVHAPGGHSRALSQADQWCDRRHRRRAARAPICLLPCSRTWRAVFTGKPESWLWSPTSTGFVALGMCIGLLIGLAQVILKEAWLKVETGRARARR